MECKVNYLQVKILLRARSLLYYLLAGEPSVVQVSIITHSSSCSLPALGINSGFQGKVLNHLF